jgi:hypothetical protein
MGAHAGSIDTAEHLNAAGSLLIRRAYSFAAPGSAGPRVDPADRVGEVLRPPPVRHHGRVDPGSENQGAGGGETAFDEYIDVRAQVRLDIHCHSPQILAASSTS